MNHEGYILEGVWCNKQKIWTPFDPFEVEIDDCIHDYQNSGWMGSACNTDQIYRYCDYWENYKSTPHQITVRFVL